MTDISSGATPCQHASNDREVLRAGVVLASDAHHATVEVASGQGCSRCAQGGGCGLGLLARKKTRHITVALGESPAPCVGAVVNVAIPARMVTLLAVLIYALPLLLALMTAGMVEMLPSPAWAPPLAFFTALGIAASGLHYFLRKKLEHFRPRLVI